MSTRSLLKTYKATVLSREGRPLTFYFKALSLEDALEKCMKSPIAKLGEVTVKLDEHA